MGGTDVGGIFGVESARAGEVLESLDRVAHETRTVRHAYWFALTLFGLIILGALPFYYPSSSPSVNQLTPSTFNRFAFSINWAAGHPWGATLYWLIAVPLGYVAVAVFYNVRARRTGVQGRVWPFVVGGIILFVVLLATTPGILVFFRPPHWYISWLQQISRFLVVHGLEPILVISAGFFILARLERSWGLFWISLAFLPVALLANLYNISNAFYRLHHWVVPDWAANIAVAGGFLVFIGLVSGLVTRRRSA
jgi:hypothetical protein